jgi:hypothetical protein
LGRVLYPIRPDFAIDPPDTLDAFYDLRDKIFIERRKLITERHEAERNFFDGSPWLLRPEMAIEVGARIAALN